MAILVNVDKVHEDAACVEYVFTGSGFGASGTGRMRLDKAMEAFDLLQEPANDGHEVLYARACMAISKCYIETGAWPDKAQWAS